MPKKKVNVFSKGNPDELFIKKECLGEGTYGTVWTGIEKATGKTCAIKIVKLDDDLEEIEQEVRIMKESDSDFVVKFFGCWWGKDRTTIWMVMEHCIAGSLNDLMYVCDATLTEPQIASACAAMVLGLEYLHKNLVIHRDIKAGNVLLNADGSVRLADFGVSSKMRNKNDKKTTAIGAPFWMAPEVINESKYDGRADIWSLGITVIELAESRPPNSHINPLRALFLIPQQDPPRLQNEQKWSKNMIHFLKICLTKNMSKRPTATALRKHPFIAEQVKLFAAEGKSAVMRDLVSSSMDKIETWRAEQSDSEYESDEEEDDQESISGLLDDMDKKAPPKMRGSVNKPAPNLNGLVNRGAEGPGGVAIKYIAPYAARDPARNETRQIAPLRDVRDPSKANKPTFEVNENQVMNIMQMDEDEDGENTAFASVMTGEFISLLKRIHEQDPNAFGGKNAADLTGEDIATAVVASLFKAVGGETNELQTMNMDGFDEEDEFNDAQFDDDDDDAPPPPPPPVTGRAFE